MKGLIGAVVALLAVLGLAACGSSGSSDQKTVTEKVTTVIKDSSSSGSSSDGSSSSGSSSNDGSSSDDSDGGSSVDVPDETGERLDVAEDDLRSNNLRYKELGGGTFGIVVRSNWTVCKQKPGARESVSENAKVKLIVDREC